MSKKGNNRGFSLVELIIVIAIMAILAGVIVLAVFPRVEQSRRQTDATTMQAWRTSAVDTFAYMGGAPALRVHLTENGLECFTGIDPSDSTRDTTAEDKFKELSGVTAGKFSEFSSEDGKALTDVYILVDASHTAGVFAKNVIGDELDKFDANGNPR